MTTGAALPLPAPAATLRVRSSETSAMVTTSTSRCRARSYTAPKPIRPAPSTRIFMNLRWPPGGRPGMPALGVREKLRIEIDLCVLSQDLDTIEHVLLPNALLNSSAHLLDGSRTA